MRSLDEDELTDRLEYACGELVDDVMVIVELRDSGSADRTVLESRLAGLPAILVGLGPTTDHRLADSMDVILDEGELERVEKVVMEHRHAAVSLAMLLRDGGRRSVGEGLVAESATYSMLQSGADHRRWLGNRSVRTRRPTADGDVVRLRRDGRHLRITLNRPESHNAFSAAMRDNLLDAFAVLASDTSLTGTLDAAGPSFCSGGDLGEFGTVDDPARAHVLRLRQSVARAMDQVSERLTVRVKGHCVGAGVELASFAQHVIAEDDATFRLPELRMGLIPGAGGTVSLPRRIGRQRTMALALSGEPIDVRVALDWGLVDAIAPSRG